MASAGRNPKRAFNELIEQLSERRNKLQNRMRLDRFIYRQRHKIEWLVREIETRITEALEVEEQTIEEAYPEDESDYDEDFVRDAALKAQDEWLAPLRAALTDIMAVAEDIMEQEVHWDQCLKNSRDMTFITGSDEAPLDDDDFAAAVKRGRVIARLPLPALKKNLRLVPFKWEAPPPSVAQAARKNQEARERRNESS